MNTNRNGLIENNSQINIKQNNSRSQNGSEIFKTKEKIIACGPFVVNQYSVEQEQPEVENFSKSSIKYFFFFLSISFKSDDSLSR